MENFKSGMKGLLANGDGAGTVGEAATNMKKEQNQAIQTVSCIADINNNTSSGSAAGFFPKWSEGEQALVYVKVGEELTPGVLTLTLTLPPDIKEERWKGWEWHVQIFYNKADNHPKSNANNEAVEAIPRTKNEPTRTAQQRVYPCPYCFQRFPDGKQLIKHLPTHKKEKEGVSNGASSKSKGGTGAIPANQAHHPRKPVPPIMNNALNDFRRHSSIPSFDRKFEVGEELRNETCKIVLDRCDSIAASLLEASQVPLNPGEMLDGGAMKLKRKPAEGINKVLPRKMLPGKVSLELEGFADDEEDPVEELKGPPPNAPKNSTLQKKNNKVHKCPICSKCFCYTRHRDSHLQFAHLGEIPFRCPICSKGFQKKGQVERHLRTIHAEDRPRHCPICSKGLGQETTLRNHLRDSHGMRARPHKCTLCTKQFHSAKPLERHMAKVHPKSDSDDIDMTTQSKPDLKCELCSEPFPGLRSLIQHIRNEHNNGVIATSAKTN